MREFPRSGEERAGLLLVRPIDDGREIAIVWAKEIKPRHGQTTRLTECKSVIVLPRGEAWSFLLPAALRLKETDPFKLAGEREQVLQRDSRRKHARALLDQFLGLAHLPDTPHRDRIVTPSRPVLFEELVTLAALYVEFLRPGASVAVLPRQPEKNLRGTFWRDVSWDLILAPRPGSGESAAHGHTVHELEPRHGPVRGMSLDQIAKLPSDSIDELFSRWAQQTGEGDWERRLVLPLDCLCPAGMTDAEFARWGKALGGVEHAGARLETARNVAAMDDVSRIRALAFQERNWEASDNSSANLLLKRLGLNDRELQELSGLLD